MDPGALKAPGTELGASVIVVGVQQGLGLAPQLAQLLRPAATQPLTANQHSHSTALAARHRGKGVCTFLDTAAHMAATTPNLTDSEQAAAAT